MRNIAEVVAEVKKLDRAITKEEMLASLDEVCDEMLPKLGRRNPTKQDLFNLFSTFEIRFNSCFIWFLEDPQMPW